MRVSRGARFVPAAGLAVVLALGGGAAQPPEAAAAKSCPSFTARFPGGKRFRPRLTVQRGSLSCSGRRSIGRRFYRNWSAAVEKGSGAEYVPVGAGWRRTGASAGSIGICKKGRVRVFMTSKG